MRLTLIKPHLDRLPGYVRALERGWSPDNLRREERAAEALQRIREDPCAFVAASDDPDARGGPIVLPDGSLAARLPGLDRWLWDGVFCGVIGFRWRPGTPDLPSHVLGHIGYAVVPWKRGRGYATEALRLLLPRVREEGLPFVELTCDPDNIPSQKVIAANGGRLVEQFIKPAAFGGAAALRFRIDL